MFFVSVMGYFGRAFSSGIRLLLSEYIIVCICIGNTWLLHYSIAIPVTAISLIILSL